MFLFTRFKKFKKLGPLICIFIVTINAQFYINLKRIHLFLKNTISILIVPKQIKIILKNNFLSKKKLR